MIFPKTTESNTRIPKNKFYANLELTPAVKKAFVDQIKAIHWRNKIAPSTSNIEAGTSVKELEVLEISLNCGELDEAVLRTIDRQIPYHILFLLSYEDKYQAVTARRSTFKIMCLQTVRLTRASSVDLQRIWIAQKKFAFMLSCRRASIFRLPWATTLPTGRLRSTRAQSSTFSSSRKRKVLWTA